MKTHFQSIFDTFRQQSSIISEHVNLAGFTGLGIQEETITDLLLNNIAYQHSDNFVTRKFSRKEEGNYSGADWLWCIGEPGAWITFAIQAKIANVYTEKVNFLHYRNGEQYSLLVNFARKFKFIPKYAIYAPIKKDLKLLARSAPGLSDIPIEHWSFSSISPTYIKYLRTQKQKLLSSVLQFSIPWTYVFQEDVTLKKPIAKLVADNLEKTFWFLENQYRINRKQKTVNYFKRINWENPPPHKLISKEMPMPVLYLMTQDKFPHKVSISHVSVFSTTPVLNALKTELEKVEKSRQWKGFSSVFARAVEEIQAPIYDKSYLLTMSEE